MNDKTFKIWLKLMTYKRRFYRSIGLDTAKIDYNVLMKSISRIHARRES